MVSRNVRDHMKEIQVGEKPNPEIYGETIEQTQQTQQTTEDIQNTPTTLPKPKVEPQEEKEKEEEKTEEQEWLETAKELKLSREKATHIVNEIFSKGEYTESFKLPGNIMLTLKTRSGEDVERLVDSIHQHNPRAMEVYNDTVFIHNAAASIVKYGKKEFKHDTNEDHEKNIKWIRKLPEPVLRVISKILQRFEGQVTHSCDDIGLGNF